MNRTTTQLALFTMALTGCTSVGDIPTAKVATASLRLANGAPAGTAIVTRAGDKLTISVALIGLPAGTHGMHLHMVGRCDTPDFASAGGHLNPAGHQHGLQNPAGSHLGDLPNVTIGSTGAGAASAELGGTSADLKTVLFDSDGTAIVIHAAADDYKTDPSGNSGPRIACGVLAPS
jgi:Cu-Zn family superoxide dismutase